MRSTRKPPTSRRKFLGPWDRLRYLYGKAFYWCLESSARGQARARGFSKQMSTVLRELSGAHTSIRGREALALNAEIDKRWSDGVRHRKMVITLIDRIRTIADSEVPIARRAILRDFSPAKLADAWDLLAISLYRAGYSRRAKNALLTSREVCSTYDIPFRGASLLSEIETLRISRATCTDDALYRRMALIYHSFHSHASLEARLLGALARDC